MRTQDGRLGEPSLPESIQKRREESRKALQAEIDRVAAKRQERVQQIKDVETEGAGTGAATTLSSKEAFALDKEVDELVKQLKTDFRELLRLANERAVLRARQ